jgi:hypothetical protein
LTTKPLIALGLSLQFSHVSENVTMVDQAPTENQTTAGVATSL